ncbi:endonuclease/exonuclease/phosphatase (EEP) superfamily protein YafD [Nocardioides thalensis]|uniref:Endonuclease/exonuclease/phosphatase (EEP) superfamily protein YafD n=1 Tax=Nocardioides thalensis TaxID=1914755 RepID=A0A853BUQ9_9ACTN|nr:peptidoglycan DD-metalloendopeptidase family protein [Nocardioides thalensis]NYI99589.1 endonuclease/exonuclease/phosphatase (EEP) superfamily protein YafD [Nocardioides thalensis]
MIEYVLVAVSRRELIGRVMNALVALVLMLAIGVVTLIIVVAGSGTQHAIEAAAAESNCDDGTGDNLWVGDVPAIEDLSTEQAENAALIVAVADQLAVSEYGMVVAVAVAWQESRLVNVDYGDRDSLGLFQQRPSTGWGAPSQVTNPRLAARAFFGRARHTSNTGLLDIRGWQTMPLGEVAQAVQRSADPTGSWYADHELFARQVVARLLTSGSDGLDGTAPVAATRQGTGTDHRLRVVHANIPNRSPDFPSALGTAIAQRPDLVSLNEMAGRSPAQFTPPGYASWRGGDRVDYGRSPIQSISNAVLWRTDRWTKVDAGRTTIVRGGPQKWDQRYAAWVTVQSADAGQVSMIATHHMINPAKYGPNRPLRQRLYLEGMHRLQDLVGRLSDHGPVFLAGDMNSQFSDNDPWGPRRTLAEIGMTSTMDVLGQLQTHVGGGTIDYIFFQDEAARPVRQWTRRIPSDHRVIGADFLTQAGESSPLGGLLCGTGAAMDCPQTPWPDMEEGLTPDALRVLRCLHQQFPTITSYGGVGTRSSNPDSSHATGRAVDAMIPGWDTPAGQSLGDQAADWVRTNASALGVSYVIWDAQIWSVARNKEGWRPYTHPSGASDPTSLHRDHVHVDVYGDSAGTGTGGGQWVIPVAGDYTLTAEFGDCSGLWVDCHTGLDFAAPTGTAVLAASSGTVEFVGHGGPYGTLIKISHGNGVETWYGHLSATDVSAGTSIVAGQPIGQVGSTGNATGPHLHFEVREQGVTVDPAPFLNDRGVIV